MESFTELSNVTFASSSALTWPLFCVAKTACQSGRTVQSKPFSPALALE
jgi:hypothetical protein